MRSVGQGEEAGFADTRHHAGEAVDRFGRRRLGVLQQATVDAEHRHGRKLEGRGQALRLRPSTPTSCQLARGGIASERGPRRQRMPCVCVCACVCVCVCRGGIRPYSFGVLSLDALLQERDGLHGKLGQLQPAVAPRSPQRPNRTRKRGVG